MIKKSRLFLLSLIILTLCISIFPNNLDSINYVSALPYEDFTEFTEVDESADITVNSATLITWDTLERGVDSYVYDDYTVDYFGDFYMEFDVEYTDVEAGLAGSEIIMNNLVVGNEVGNGTYLITGDCILLSGLQNGGTDDNIKWYLRQYTGGGMDFQVIGSVYGMGMFYLSLNRTGTWIEARYYSDSERTVLVESLNSSSGDTTAYRYLHALASEDGAGNPTDHSSGTIENLDLDPLAEGGNLIYPDHVESSGGGTNATHTLLNNQTYGSFTPSGWIIWDYGSTIENVTRITWDVTHAVTHSMYRLEVSPDVSPYTWTIVAQPQGKAGSPPTSTEEWTRYDSEMSGRFRYIKMTPVSQVTSSWYVDSVWLTVQPPAIDYSDVSYVYPQEVQDWNWEISGFGAIATNYASQPHAMLGKNETVVAVVTDGYNDSTKLVNADFDADNMAVVKFDDYYNLTSVEMHFSSSLHHVYLYMSTDAVTWTFVADWTGIISGGWYGATINGTRIRYLKANSTAIMDACFYIESFRIVGDVHVGEGPPPDDNGYDWNFWVFPNWLADALGIPVLAGQLLASACVLACFLLPFAFYERRSFWATIIVGLVVFAFLVAMGWLPTWLMLLLTLLIAGLFGYRFSKWWGGR